MNSLIETRDRLGEQQNLLEFCQQMDLRRINRRVLDALIKSGSLDDWGVERAQLQGMLDQAIERGNQFHQQRDSGQGQLFGELEVEIGEKPLLTSKPWTLKQRLAGEKETLGFYLSGHPTDAYQHEFGRAIGLIGQLKVASGKKALVCGLVNALRRIVTKSGKRLAILTLEDASGRIDCVVFSEILDNLSVPLSVGDIFAIEGEVGQDDYSGGVKLTASAIHSIPCLRERLADYLAVRLTAEDASKLPDLQQVLSAYPGDNEVRIHYMNHQALGVLSLGKPWRVALADELLERLQELFAPNQVEVCY